MKPRGKRNKVPAALALLSVGQIAAGAFIVLFAGAVLSVPTGCVQASPLLQTEEEGRAVYFDFSALLARFATPCAVPAAAPVKADLVAPFAAEAQRRRNDRAESDPAYVARADAELNRNRINFLFFAYGETYEPPYPPDFKGSLNVFSLDLHTLNVSTVTLNHDIRAPEVERFRQTTDKKQGPTRIDQAYPVGGFDVMRLAVEDATGLSVDYQFVMADSVIKEAVDDLFGGIRVEVPFDFDAMAIYYDGAKYEPRHYAQGAQLLDGLAAIQFIKALNAGNYDAAQELTVRKQIVVHALLNTAKSESGNPLFWTRAIAFLRGQLQRQKVAFDFDPFSLALEGIQSSLTAGLSGAIALPSLGQSLYVVDDRSGDGGVEWVTGSQNPIVRNDLENGVYIDQSFSIPKDGADPYAPDLVAHYWTTIRELVKQRLTTP